MVLLGVHLKVACWEGQADFDEDNVDLPRHHCGGAVIKQILTYSFLNDDGCLLARTKHATIPRLPTSGKDLNI